MESPKESALSTDEDDEQSEETRFGGHLHSCLHSTSC